MITITEQTITMTVASAKEIMRQLVTSELIEHDEATFSLKMIGRGNAEIILPFPNCLSTIEPVNDKNGH